MNITCEQAKKVAKINMLYVLLKALPLVCMKYTAQDESRLANIARGKSECYVYHEALIKSCICSYGVLVLYCITEVSTKRYNSWVILTQSLNK